MSDWLAIAQWNECAKFAQPGIIFELRNAEGQTMLSPCVLPLPPAPASWSSPAVVFRTIPQPKAQHSNPIPTPVNPD